MVETKSTGSPPGNPQRGVFPEYVFLPGETKGHVQATHETYQALHTLARLLPDFVRTVDRIPRGSRFRVLVGARTYVHRGPCGAEYVVSENNVLVPDCVPCEDDMIARVERDPSWLRLDAEPAVDPKAVAAKKAALAKTSSTPPAARPPPAGSGRARAEE